MSDFANRAPPLVVGALLRAANDVITLKLKLEKTTRLSPLFNTTCGSDETKANVASKALDHLFDWNVAVLTVNGANCMRIGRGL